MLPRPMKLEFPRFKGGNPTSWIYRAIQLFHYYQIYEAEKKVLHASYHLVRAVQLRFGLANYDDPMESLTKLKHTTIVIAYKGKFESLSNRIRNLSNMHKLSCFISGLGSKDAGT
jgi:hypothetical protein